MGTPLQMAEERSRCASSRLPMVLASVPQVTREEREVALNETIRSTRNVCVCHKWHRAPVGTALSVRRVSPDTGAAGCGIALLPVHTPARGLRATGAELELWRLLR